MRGVAYVPWVTLTLVGASIVAGILPGGPGALEYEPAAVVAGEAWRTLTSQVVHWTPRMTVADLAVLLAVGVWLERRSRRLAGLSLAVGAMLVALVLAATPDMPRYRGSSGLASAVFAAAAVYEVRAGSGWPRAVAALAVAALAAKIGWETWTGLALFSGELPPGIEVRPAVHGAGALGGAVATIAAHRWRVSRQAVPRRPGEGIVASTAGPPG